MEDETPAKERRGGGRGRRDRNMKCQIRRLRDRHQIHAHKSVSLERWREEKESVLSYLD
jgi:hypothetical protein